MSEEFLERLSRFKPDAGGLDRDALLFAAGRASARPNRGWVALAALLANTQILSLVFLWPRLVPPGGGSTVAVAFAPVSLPPATVEPRTSEGLAGPGIWSTRHRPLESETDNLPDETVSLIDSGPPLKAFGPRPTSLVN
jgi:hypothetical protein